MLGWLWNVSKIFTKSVSFGEFSGFHAGILNDYVIFAKYLLKLFAIVDLLDTAPFLVLRVNFCL